MEKNFKMKKSEPQELTKEELSRVLYNSMIAKTVLANQNALAPNNIIATMVKKVDVAAYSAIKDVTEGKFSQGTNILGLKEDGVGYTTEGSNIKVPQEIIDEVEKIKQKIVSGELVIPDTPESVDEFLKNNTYSK